MNFIAGLLLLVTRNEEKTFSLVNTLLNDILPGTSFSTPANTLLNDTLPGTSFSTPVNTLLNDILPGTSFSTPVNTLLNDILPGPVSVHLLECSV